jgi:hypothetical protein
MKERAWKVLIERVRENIPPPQSVESWPSHDELTQYVEGLPELAFVFLSSFTLFTLFTDIVLFVISGFPIPILFLQHIGLGRPKSIIRL